MATFSKTVRATSSALYAKEGGRGGRFGPQISGEDAHLYLSADDGFNYTGAFKFTLDTAFWSGVLDVDKAVLRFHNVPRQGHLINRANSGYQLRFIDTRAFEDNSKQEGEWEVPEEDATTRSPAYDSRYVKNGSISTTTVGGTESIDVTDWLRRWAPRTKKVKGKKGLGVTNRGIWAVRRNTTKQSNSRIVWGSAHADEEDRPELIVTYKGGDPRGTVLVTGATNPLPSIEGSIYEGTYVPGVEGARLSRLHIKLVKRNAANTAWETTIRWQNGTSGEAVSASEAETGDWTYPVGGSSGYPLKAGLLASGVRYAFQVRAYSNRNVWSDWTTLQEIKVQADSPVFEERDLLPNAVGSGATFSEPTSETLLNVQFGGRFRGSGANLTLGLLSYRVQVRDETAEMDPDWDEGGMHWDTGQVPVSAEQATPPTATTPVVFGSRYRGRLLEAGTYSFRVMVVNRTGEPSAWRYGTFVLTLGQDLDPADNESNLTGYARRQPKVRIKIRSIEANPQKIVTRSTSGSYRLKYDGSTSAHRTVAIAYNASAATVEAALEALPGIGNLTVSGPVIDGTKRTYTVTFVSGGLLEPEKIGVYSNSLVNSGNAGIVRIDIASTRKPGRVIAIIDDASNIGASEYYNSAGEFYFTLPHTHPQISVIEPWQVHYELEMHRGNGWEWMTGGLIHDFDADDEQVVFYGADYLGILQMMIDERFNSEGSPKRPAILYPDSGWASSGSYYLNKTIKQIVQDQIDQAIHGTDSPLAFFSRGTIADMSETIIIYCTFKPRLEFITGLLESWKGKGTSSKRTRIRARRTGAGGWEFRVDDNPGFSRDNIEFAYGGLVNGFRVVPYGQFGTRVNAMGREIGGSKLQYTIAKTPVPSGEDDDFNEVRYGRWPTVNLWQDITDKADLSRRARQFARSIGKVGKQVGLGLRVDAMSLKDGWDITDSVPVKIRRGIIDTTLYQPDSNGRSWWTIWGWVLKVSPDGHTNLTLSILPREDTLAASEDITPSEPILSSLSEFVIHPTDPTEADADGSVKHWVNSVTGHVYELDPETGLWVDLSDTVLGAPQFLVNDAITRARINDELQPILNVVNHYLIPLNADEDGYDADVAALYPAGTLVWDQTLLSVWSVEEQGDRMVWVRSEGQAGAPGAIPSYPTEPDLGLIHVTELPALPDGGYPVGTQVYLSTADEYYVNDADVWQQFAFEPSDTLFYDTSALLMKKFEFGAWVPVVNSTDLTGQIADGQIATAAVSTDAIALDAVDVTRLAPQIVLSAPDLSRSIQTTDDTQHVVMGDTGLHAYDSSGAPIFSLPSVGDASIVADVSALSLVVDPAGAGSSLGGATSLPGGSIATLAAGVANPTVAPTVTDTLESLALATAPVGHGICYDPSGTAAGGVPTYLVGGDPSLVGGYVFKEYNAATGALVRTISPSNSSSVDTDTVGSTSHVSDTADAYTGASNDQVAVSITLPTLGAGETMKVTAVSAYFAGYGGSCTARTMLWTSGGTELGQSAEFTAASEAFGVGNSNHYNKSLTSKVTVTSGQTVRAGFAHTDSADGFQFDVNDGAGTMYIGDGGSGDLTSLTTDSSGKPNVYVTVEITSTTVVEGTMGKIVGIARAGSYIFVLDSLGTLFRYTQATGAYSAKYSKTTEVSGVKANAGLFYDGTDLVIVTSTAATGVTTLKLVKVNTSGVTGTTITGDAITNGATVVLRGGYNDGTNFWLYNSLGLSGAAVYAYDKTTGVVVANRSFSSSAEAASGVTYDGTVFRAWVSATTTVWKYTTWDWATSTVAYWFAYSWVDVGVGETAVSPRTTLTIGRRRRVSVVNPAPPGSPVDSVYVYAYPNASEPAGTSMKRQATGLATSRFLSTYDSGGAAGLSTTSFGAGSSAEIKSESTTGWSLKGDGTVVINAAQPIGGKPPIMRQYLNAGSPHTWTKPAGLVALMVEVCGAGGGGAGVANPTALQVAVGAGGGGGGYARYWYTAAELAGAASGTVTVGGGGSAGTTSGTAGGTGGSSTFAFTGMTTLQGNGGGGGGTMAVGTTNAVSDGGSGGSHSGPTGYHGVYGQDAPNAIRIDNQRMAAQGHGAGSHFGGATRASGSATEAAGVAGQLFGGGAAGGYSKEGAAQAGAIGAAGVVVVTEYYGA